ncbi:MAG: hypothetical protein JOZ83_03615 [Silvibacterium sp.]|nr:hypothetical protein [Silvibacterium sp.]
MSTILEIPIPKVQNTLVIDPPLTDDEFERMCMTTASEQPKIRWSSGSPTAHSWDG